MDRKEQLLDQIDAGVHSPDFKEQLLKAMDIFAKQEAINFAEFIELNFSYSNGSYSPKNVNNFSIDDLTIPQLYKLYTKQQSLKQIIKHYTMNLTEDQIQVVIEWMNTWEQLKDTAIPIRFKEDFMPKEDKMQRYRNIVNTIVSSYGSGISLDDTANYLKNQIEPTLNPNTDTSKVEDEFKKTYGVNLHKSENLTSTPIDSKEVNKQNYFLTNDEVYYTFGEKKEIFCLNTKSNSWGIDRHPEMYKQLMEGYDKFFYSEDKAKEFVLNNKPCLSLSDVGSIMGGNIPICYLTQFKESVKSKLNQQ
jgi:hypothetical protein